MVRQTNLTGAESCWEDDADTEADCEKFLQKQAARPGAVADAVEEDVDDEEEESDADENAEDDEIEAEDDTDPAAETPDDVSSEVPAAQLEDNKMAKAKTGSKTKADSIREIIAARQAAGKDLRPKDIIEALNKKGIEVNASQVSITLRAMGVPAIKRGAGAKTKPAAVPAPAVEEPKSRATAKGRAAIEESVDGSGHAELQHTSELLETAADFMNAAGGYDRARAVLDMCHKVIQRS